VKAIVLAPLVLVCALAAAAPPAGFEDRVDSLRQQIGVPGMAIAIVEKNKVTLARGFGVRGLNSPQPVDADTIFPNGSTGKAFTVAALGILVDQKKIDWDDKVIDRLPGFQMYDPSGPGRGRPAVRAPDQFDPRRIRQAPSLFEAGDELSQWLRLRQRAVHGGGAADRIRHR
jgi:CubicO group peptidase (beta-lactamase class C family)